jgi:hypothetical protein
LFSSSGGSRKTRNLIANRKCVVTTEDAASPVVLEETAELIKDRAALETLLNVMNEKYRTSYGMDMLDPDVNAAFRVRPTWAFGLRQDDFTGSPTRWSFSQPTQRE